MKSRSRARRVALGTGSVLALALAGFTTTGAATGTAASAPAKPVFSSSDNYINYAEPAVQPGLTPDVEVTKNGKTVVHQPRGGAATKAPDPTVVAQSKALDRKLASGNPAAARGLAKLEAQSLKTGKSPKQIKASKYKQAKSTQQAKLLTILVEFNNNANDDFSDQYVPTYWGSSTCKLGNVQNGPLHNNIPNPASLGLADNNSMWVPDFSSKHFNDMLYTDTGITERVRPDLTGPDGKPGFDISGYTMKKMYEEMSHKAYTVSGAATPWVTVPHSEGWYGAQRCYQDANGNWVAGAYQTMNGHRDNPDGASRLPIDAVAALAQAQPDFPWEDYDVEDQSDRDGDGNLNEPDGVIDHVVLVHAGEDKSGGGGAQGTYSIWAHSSSVPGGAKVPGHDLYLSNYIVQPEDAGVGVFAHEYGHDLGLPDLYDTSGAGDSDIDFWDLMNSGSHSGPIFQSMPTHMGLWDKWVLGWADPVELKPGDQPRTVNVGQASRPLKGTEDGVKIDLPDKVVTLATPHSGSGMWYSGADQSWADARLTRTVDVPADPTFSFWADYVIEADWDFGFVEVSTDGGKTWAEQPVTDDAGKVLTTPADYADPNGRMTDFGDKKFGLTGTTGGWKHLNVDLSPWTGQTVQVRLRYATDEAFQERGWFSDDFTLTSGSQTVWSDVVETTDPSWTQETTTFVDTTGAGWHVDSGTSVQAQYYLVEWRNLDGFDEGLKYGYSTTYGPPDNAAWKVQKIRYNAPGALIWYRDTTYGSANLVTANVTALPSTGPKGGLLLVDSHYKPLRRDASATPDTTTLKNLPSRAQSSNVAFGLQPTSPFTDCITGADPTKEFCTSFGAQAPVATFSDDLGWYPGIEFHAADESVFFADQDASAVVPSLGNAPYSVKITDEHGALLPDLFGEDIGLGVPLGTGNPKDDGVGYGTVVTVKKAAKDNTSAQIAITPPRAN